MSITYITSEIGQSPYLQVEPKSQNFTSCGIIAKENYPPQSLSNYGSPMTKLSQLPKASSKGVNLKRENQDRIN